MPYPCPDVCIAALLLTSAMAQVDGSNSLCETVSLSFVFDVAQDLWSVKNAAMNSWT